MTTSEEDRPDEVEGEAFSAGRAGSPDEKGVTQLSALGPPPWRPICMTCGVQFAPRDTALDICPICADERQYIGWNGQQWTTLEGLADHLDSLDACQRIASESARITRPSYELAKRL